MYLTPIYCRITWSGTFGKPFWYGCGRFSSSLDYTTDLELFMSLALNCFRHTRTVWHARCTSCSTPCGRYSIKSGCHVHQIDSTNCYHALICLIKGKQMKKHRKNPCTRWEPFVADKINLLAFQAFIRARKLLVRLQTNKLNCSTVMRTLAVKSDRSAELP